MIQGVPYWRLSAVYFGYFAVIGGITPYWTAFLDNRGFSPHIIGLLAAIPMVTRLIAPYFWGQIADLTGKRIQIIRIGVVGALLSFSVLLVWQNFWTLLIATFVFSFFWNAVLPQFEGLTLGHLGPRAALYSQIRLWGSVGFIVMVFALGILFDYVSIKYLPASLMVGLLLVCVVTLILPDAGSIKPPGHLSGSVASVMRKPTIIGFFIAVFLLQVSHGIYYGFYTLHLQDYGYSRTLIGALWSLGVIAEIVLFIYAPKIFAVFSLRQCLLISLAVAVMRWLIIALAVDNLTLLALAQLGHAFTFGLIHAVAMAMLRLYFSHDLQGRGQAIYSAVGFGAGSAVGTYAAGWLWSFGGSVTFIVAAIVAVIAFLSALVAMPKVNCPT